MSAPPASEREESGRMRYGAPPSVADVLHEGDVVAQGCYEILGVLGRGGMATVYSARRVADGVEVALKVVKEKLARRADIEYRMRNELDFAAELAGHPNIVQPLEAGRLAELDDAPYLVTERVTGRPLSRIIATDRSLPPARAWRIALDVAQALRALHERGIIHRDVKPENIIVGADDRGVERAKLIDFGLVTRIRSDAAAPRVTAIDERPGTKLYMAPEQAAGAAAASSFDVYALGVTLHEMLAGIAPLAALPDEEMLRHKLAGDEPELAIGRMRIDLAEGAVDLVDGCLRRDARKRLTIADVCERLAELAAVATTSAPDAIVAPSGGAAPSADRRGPTWWRWGVAVVIVGGVAGYAWMSRAPAVSEAAVAPEPRVHEAAVIGDVVVPSETKAVSSPEPRAEPRPVAPSTVDPPVGPIADPSPAVTPPPVNPPVHKPPVPKAAPPHASVECAQRREDVDAAVGARRWSQVLELTSRAACWSDGATRRVARIHAFVGLRRYEDCAKAADSGNVPAEVADMVAYCREKMESP